MIIDLILDRQDGASYSPKSFYDRVVGYSETFPEIANPIATALDSGDEIDVKRELSKYVIDQDYNPEIISYIQSVNWL